MSFDGGIILVDADDESITVSWPRIGKSSSSRAYSLQYRACTSSSDDGIDSGGSLLYSSLSTELSGTSAKKKNLTGAGHGFWFRVSASNRSQSRVDKTSMDYVTHACRRPFMVLTMREQSRRMEAPRVYIDPKTPSPQPNSYTAHVTWATYDDDDGGTVVGYKLQMRENDGKYKWATVAKCLSGIEVKKKNLTSRDGYMFRVRPVIKGESGGKESNLNTSVSEGGSVVPFSTASVVVGEKKAKSSTSSSVGNEELYKLFKKLPNDALLAKGGKSKCRFNNTFGNVDIVFLYAASFSSNTCKKFNPDLVKFYKDCKKLKAKTPSSTKSVEIIYISNDSSVSDFKSFYSTMPWTAVPYDCDVRQQVLKWMKCKNMPALMCLDGRTGKILERNSYGRALELPRFNKLFKEGGKKLGLI